MAARLRRRMAAAPVVQRRLQEGADRERRRPVSRAGPRVDLHGYGHSGPEAGFQRLSGIGCDADSDSLWNLDEITGSVVGLRMENSDPAAGDSRSTRPVSRAPLSASTVKLARWPG